MHASGQMRNELLPYDFRMICNTNFVYEPICYQRWRQGRNTGGGGKNCRSGDNERSEQNLYGPHLSDWL